MALKIFISGFLWIVFIVSPTLANAQTNNTTIGISVVVSERAENQQCVVGFENSLDNKLTPMQTSGCHYDSEALMQTAYQQITKHTKNYSHSFVTVVITAP